MGSKFKMLWKLALFWDAFILLIIHHVVAEIYMSMMFGHHVAYFIPVPNAVIIAHFLWPLCNYEADCDLAALVVDPCHSEWLVLSELLSSSFPWSTNTGLHMLGSSFVVELGVCLTVLDWQCNHLWQFYAMQLNYIFCDDEYENWWLTFWHTLWSGLVWQRHLETNFNIYFLKRLWSFQGSVAIFDFQLHWCVSILVPVSWLLKSA